MKARGALRLSAALLLACAAPAFGQVPITFSTTPSFIDEGQTVSLSITFSSTTSRTVTKFRIRNTTGATSACPTTLVNLGTNEVTATGSAGAWTGTGTISVTAGSVTSDTVCSPVADIRTVFGGDERWLNTGQTTGSITVRAADTQVSNTGQTLAGGSAAASMNTLQAQPFTTGTNAGGYTISQVDLRLGNITGGNVDPTKAKVSIYTTSSGNPNTSLYTLTNPASFTANAANTFSAPANANLDANTTYAVVVEATTSSATVSLGWTAATAEDSGAAAGWSIANSRRSKTGSGGWSSGTNQLMIAIKGGTWSGPVVGITGGSAVTEGGNATFTVSASPVPSADLTVNLAISQTGSYVASGDLGSKTVTVPTAGSATYTVATVDDSTDETNGAVAAAVARGAGYTRHATVANRSASVTVNDNDDPAPATPVVSITGGSAVTEGGSATFTVSASPAPSANLTVNLTISQTGSFVAAGNLGSKTVTVPTSGSATYSVATVNDSADEANGAVAAALATGTGYSLHATNRSASVTVNDNDDPAPATPAGTPVSLVSNTGQPDVDQEFDWDIAQAFSTGSSSAGFKLTGVSLELEQAAAGETQLTLAGITVSVRSNTTASINGTDTAVPGASLGTLTDPASIPATAAATRFTAPAGGIELAANTTYWVLVDMTAGKNDATIHTTTSGAEDAGAAAGWSIANDTRFRGVNLPGWTVSASGARSLQIDIQGYAVTKFVGNTGVTPRSTIAGAVDYAQKFSTGSSAPGYKLTSLGIRMLDGSGTAPTYTASIHSDSSNAPDTSTSGTLGTLTNPGSWPGDPGLGLHAAPSGGIALEADTDYWLVFDITNASTSTTEWLRYRVLKDEEDAGAAAGWSIADTSRNRVWDNPAWRNNNYSLTFAINGVENPGVTGVEIVSNAGADQTYGLGEKILVRLTYNAAVTVGTSGGTPRLQIKMDPAFGEKWANYESGSGTKTLQFAYTVASPNKSPGGIAVLEDTLALNGGTIKFTASQADAPLAHAGLAHDPDHKVDWEQVTTPPPPPTPPPPGTDPGGGQPGTGGQPGSGGTTEVQRDPVPLQLALWTDKPGYRAGDTVRLYRSLKPHDDDGRYRTLVYLEKAGGGERRWLAPLSAEGELHADAVDVHGVPSASARPRLLSAADRELAFEGEAPEPGLWQFVLELRPGSPDEQAREPDLPLSTRRAWAKFAVAERGQLLNRRGFDRELTRDATLRSEAIYYLGHQLFVRAGATLTIEPGTVLQAWGQHAAIIVEPGARIVAEGTREAPVVLTCSSLVGYREPGCWGGLRILGNAPVTRLEGVAPGVLPPEQPVYGGTDEEDSSGVLRYVRVEFAGASDDPEAALPAIGLYGAGSGTVLDHVQARESLGDGIAFHGGTAACDHCVASGSGHAGLSWDRGWRGGASHLYVQHGTTGIDGLVGGSDEEGHDLEPRSLPALSNVTLLHSRPYGRRARRGVGVRLRTGSGLAARDVLVTRFFGGAIKTRGRSGLLFDEGESSFRGALLWLNGYPQVPLGIAEAVEFANRDPKLRDVRDFPNPDPRPKADSPALTGEGEGYIGAFGTKENWLEEWTVFGPESEYDLRERSDDEE